MEAIFIVAAIPTLLWTWVIWKRVKGDNTLDKFYLTIFLTAFFASVFASFVGVIWVSVEVLRFLLG